MEKLKVNTVEEAIHDFREGKFVIVVDDEDRENEGDLICAAEKITPEMVNFMHSPSPSTRSKDARLACLHMTALPPLRH